MSAINELLLQSSTSAILVVSLIKATLVLAIAQLVVTTARDLSAAARHLILTAGLAAFMVIPALSLLAPRWNVTVATAPAAVVAPAVTAPELPLTTVTEMHAVAAPIAAQSRLTLPELTLTRVSAFIWLSVALLLMGRLLRSVVRVRAIVRSATEPSERLLDLLDDVRARMHMTSDVQLLMSDRVDVPMVWGVRRGTLLLPEVAEEWTDEHLRATLIHELGHLQRLDYVSLALMNVVSALLWFHPQVWTARTRALTEGERACDDLVLRAGERASEYASHLLHVARLMPRREPLSALLAMSRPSQLEGRMYAILSTSVNRQGIGGKLLMMSLTVFVAVVVPLALVQPVIAAPVAPVPPLATMVAAAEPAPAPPAPAPRTAVDAPPPPVVDAPPAPPAVDAPPAPPAVDAPEAPPADDQAANQKSKRERNWTRRDTGTCADYQHNFRNHESAARGEQTLSYSGNHLNVQASGNGAVRVRRSSTGAFTVLACKAAAGDTRADADAVLSRVSVQERGGRLAIDGPDGGDWTVDLIIEVPDGRGIDIDAKNGPVAINGINAAVNASVMNGPLALSNSRGSIKVRSTNGPLAITRMAGDIDAAVKNGPLTVTLDNAWTGGELRASVENGPLALTLPPDYASGVEVKTRGGAPFSCSLPACKSLGLDRRGMPPSMEPRDLRFGSGPTQVFLSSGNGPVAISQ